MQEDPWMGFIVAEDLAADWPDAITSSARETTSSALSSVRFVGGGDRTQSTEKARPGSESIVGGDFAGDLTSRRLGRGGADGRVSRPQFTRDANGAARGWRRWSN